MKVYLDRYGSNYSPFCYLSLIIEAGYGDIDPKTLESIPFKEAFEKVLDKQFPERHAHPAYKEQIVLVSTTSREDQFKEINDTFDKWKGAQRYNNNRNDEDTYRYQTVTWLVPIVPRKQPANR